MMRLKMTSASLQSLAQAVAQEHYVTTKAHLELMQSLCHEGVVKEMGEIALALFMQLQEPGKDEKDEEMDNYEQSRRALQRIKEIFGLAGDTPPVPPPTSGLPISQALIHPRPKGTPAKPFELCKTKRQRLQYLR